MFVRVCYFISPSEFEKNHMNYTKIFSINSKKD